MGIGASCAWKLRSGAVRGRSRRGASRVTMKGCRFRGAIGLEGLYAGSYSLEGLYARSYSLEGL